LPKAVTQFLLQAEFEHKTVDRKSNALLVAPPRTVHGLSELNSARGWLRPQETYRPHLRFILTDLSETWKQKSQKNYTSKNQLLRACH